MSTTGALANDGTFGARRHGASVGGSSLTVAGALTNSGSLGIDNYYGGGGSTLSIGGALTNTGTLDVGNSPAGPDKVTAASLDNTGSIDLTELRVPQPDAPRRDRGQRGIRHGGSPERRCSTLGRQRDRVRERADHHDRRGCATCTSTETTPSSRTARRSARTAP